MRIFAFLACFLVLGCSYKSSTETIADGAKESISDIYESLPKECQSKQTKVAFDGAMKQVESVKANCVSEMKILNEKIKQRNLLIVGLIVLLLGLVARKAQSILSKII